MSFFLARVKQSLKPVLSHLRCVDIKHETIDFVVQDNPTVCGFELELWVKRFLARARFDTFNLQLETIGEITNISIEFYTNIHSNHNVDSKEP